MFVGPEEPPSGDFNVYDTERTLCLFIGRVLAVTFVSFAMDRLLAGGTRINLMVAKRSANVGNPRTVSEHASLPLRGCGGLYAL